MTSVLANRPRATAHAQPARSGWEHRPALDGLRVLAVYLVVAYHGGLSSFPGGFVGVDLFFVLSGFLVTSVLLAEQQAHGRIRLRRFYARRMRRILPAAAVTIVGTAAMFVLVAPPADREAALGGARAAFLYFANWHFLGQANDYFAAEEDPSPFLHFWSLAIEEQFYFVFPFVLAALLVLARRAGKRPLVVAGGLGLLCGLSLASQLVSARSSELRAYYATDARLYQILAGSTLAAVLWFWPRRSALFAARALPWVAPAGLVTVASSWWSLSPSARGIATTALAVVTIGSIEARRTGSAARVLSRPTMTYLGQISYGTYLWHWPVIVVAARVIDLRPAAATVASAVAGTALAALSHRVLESPIRTSVSLGRWNRRVIAAGLTASVAGAAVAAPAILRSDRPMAAAVTPSAPAAVPRALDAPVPAGVPWRAARKDKPQEPVCLDRPAAECVIVDGVGPHLHLVGDSHAKTLLPLFERLALDHGYTFSATVTGACPWQRGLIYKDNEERTARCSAMQPDWYDRVIPELDPDIVVLFDRAFDDPAFSRTMTSLDPDLASLDQTTLLRTTSERTLADLERDGRRVVILEPTPLVGRPDPTACLSGAKLLSECAFEANRHPLSSEAIYRYADVTSPAVWSIDIDRLACPDLPVCMPMVDGVIVRRDRHHLTGTYTRTLSENLKSLLDERGVL